MADDGKIGRRDFFARAAMWTGLLGAYGTAAGFAVRFLLPEKTKAKLRSIYVGRLADLADGGTREVVDLRGLPLVVVRSGAEVRALSTVCPHLGCRVRWENQKQRFLCPCHTAVFSPDGKVVSGPPPRPLDQYEVEIVAGNVYLMMKEPLA